ncbi:MAG TPA: AMP-binding protein [Streptosporangiaceae bacterium]|nr:AMP-binding protein [Streptosporangiaceae bacterium]
MSTDASESLLSWVSDPDPGRGIRFALPGTEWDLWTYDRLAGLVRQAAAGLRARGVRRGDVVSLVQRSGPHFVGSVFGAMMVGAIPSPIAPPLTFQDPDVYRDHVTGLTQTARPALVVTDADLAGSIASMVEVAPVVTTADILSPDALDVPEPGETALLQFTSGSSGRARGVAVPAAALAVNVAAIRAWLRMTPEDATASWLPIHHDMGLIGCLITPVVNRSDLWLLPPEEFIHNPVRYLRCFDAPSPGQPGAVLTSMPNFGLGYVTRRVKPQALAGMDFSAWRTVIVGAERVDDQVLDRFCALLGPHGLDRRAILPAYGMAEATLAVTGLPLEEEWRTVRFGPDAQPVTGCGRPLGGVSVSVRDEQDQELPDGQVGEIVVTGPSVARGYQHQGESASLTRIEDGVLHTADAGFLVDGQLFVLGRLGDSLKLRGRAVFAEDLELAMGQAGVPPLRMAALLGYRAGAPTVVAVFEQARPEWLETATHLLRRSTEGAEVVLLDAPRGAIARTSSGKPKRRRLWQAFVDDDMAGAVEVPIPSAARTQTLEMAPGGNR